MERLRVIALLGTAALLASCATPMTPEAASVPKSPDWLCSISFNFGDELDVVFLGTGATREAAAQAARDDCARRRAPAEEKGACLRGPPVNENCSSPE